MSLTPALGRPQGSPPIGVRLSRRDSLPPCGGGWGGGSCRGAQECKLARPPPPTPPHKGEGRSSRLSSSLNLTPMGATLVPALRTASVGSRATIRVAPAIHRPSRGSPQPDARAPYPAAAFEDVVALDPVVTR